MLEVYFITSFGLTSNNGGAYVQFERLDSIEEAKQMCVARNYESMIVDSGYTIRAFNYDKNPSDGEYWKEVEDITESEIEPCYIWDYVDRKMLSGSVLENMNVIRRIAISYDEMLEREPEYMYTDFTKE